MTGQVFLASYPKSGNTWLRAMLSVYLAPDRPLSLDELVGRNPYDRLSALSELLGVDAALLDTDELDVARAGLYRATHDPAGPPVFLKTHLANRTVRGRPIFDASTGRAVYLVRHPADVAVSFAPYAGLDVAEICRLMTAPQTVLNRRGDRAPLTGAQFLSSWAGHVRSWTERPPLPVLTVRYEDLSADPAAELARVLAFCDLPVDDAVVAHAVRESAFDRLQRLEATDGFSERPSTTDRAFRSGRAGEGVRTLPADLLAELVADAGAVMAHHGYDTATGRPTAGGG